MKIYLVIEASGEYEDYCEHTLGAFLKREKAEELIAKCKDKDFEIYDKWAKCSKCPGYWGNSIELDYCPHMTSCRMCVDEDGDEQLDCDEYVPYYEVNSYWIKELEVVE